MVTSKTSVRERLEAREELLSPLAARSAASAGRAEAEPPCPLRTEFQRDRDRIIHSKAFRRLKHKTQVFTAPLGDHYVTRLTHTLEVSQIARTIARALNLSEDLAEAIALGHDLGHTPFGHVGEDEMDRLVRGTGKIGSGFRHARQSLRVVEKVARGGLGLNLTQEVRHGIVSHSKPQGDFLSPDMVSGLTLEAQIVRISDAVAYLNHDLQDAFRAGVFRCEDVPTEVTGTLGERHSERIGTIVSDIVENSEAARGENGYGPGSSMIRMGDEVRSAVNCFRAFMFERVYLPEDAGIQGRAARRIVTMLFEHYSGHPDQIPPEYRLRAETAELAVIDYISGMTDNYAIRRGEELRPGIAGPLMDGVR